MQSPSYISRILGSWGLVVRADICRERGHRFNPKSIPIFFLYLAISRCLVKNDNLPILFFCVIILTYCLLRKLFSSVKAVSVRQDPFHCRCAGCLVVYALGFVLRWDTIAIYAPLIPLAALVIGIYVPESPIYLMTKVRDSRTEVIEQDPIKLVAFIAVFA